MTRRSGVLQLFVDFRCLLIMSRVPTCNSLGVTLIQVSPFFLTNRKTYREGFGQDLENSINAQVSLQSLEEGVNSLLHSTKSSIEQYTCI